MLDFFYVSAILETAAFLAYFADYASVFLYTIDDVW